MHFIFLSLVPIAFPNMVKRTLQTEIPLIQCNCGYIYIYIYEDNFYYLLLHGNPNASTEIHEMIVIAMHDYMGLKVLLTYMLLSSIQSI